MDVEPLGCSTEVLLFTGYNKVAQMSQFHIDTYKASEL